MGPPVCKVKVNKWLISQLKGNRYPRRWALEGLVGGWGWGGGSRAAQASIRSCHVFLRWVIMHLSPLEPRPSELIRGYPSPQASLHLSGHMLVILPQDEYWRERGLF